MSKKQLRKGHRQKRQQNNPLTRISQVSDNAIIAEVVLLVFGILLFVLGIYAKESFPIFIGVACLLIAGFILLSILNDRVWMDKTGITVQNLFHVTHFYAFSDVQAYHVSATHTILYLKDRRKINLSDKKMAYGEAERVIAHCERSGAVEDTSTAGDCPLYWGNCSRPVQMTLFLSLLGGASLFVVLGILIGCAPMNEKDLTYQTIYAKTVSVDADTQNILLKASDGISYEIKEGLSKYLPETGEMGSSFYTVGVLQSDPSEVCVLQASDGSFLYTLDQYNLAKGVESLGVALLFSIIPIGFLVCLITVLLAYAKPDTFTGLYIHWETASLWTRHRCL